MKNINTYIGTMYPPAFRTLCMGLSIFALTLCIFAVSLRGEILAGESDFIFRYPKMLEEIMMPICVLIPIVIVVDLNERRKNK